MKACRVSFVSALVSIAVLACGNGAELVSGTGGTHLVGGGTGGGSTGQPGGAGHEGGASGHTGGSATPTARAGVTATIAAQSTPVAGKTCSSSFIARIGDPPITNNDASGLLTDGQDGAQIECTVSAGPPFDIMLSAVAPVTTAGGPVDFAASGRIDANAIGSGNVSVRGSLGLLANSPGSPCRFNVNGAELQIAEGRVWAEFSCAMVQDPSSPNTTACSMSGVLAFDNCKQ